MIQADSSEILIRASALYVPTLLAIAGALYRRTEKQRLVGALLASMWNLPALLALNVAAQHFGWWTFHVTSATVAGVPVDLWIGWAVLWGAVPMLATRNHLVLACLSLLAADLVLMPLAHPVVQLHESWLVGEAVGLLVCLLPALLLGSWTARIVRIYERTTLQVVAFSGLLLFVTPSLIFTLSGEDWSALMSRPRWHFLLATMSVAAPGAMAIQAVREFAVRGRGTPVPLDPPTQLVRSGPYAYVANPMQVGATIVLALWGIMVASPAVIAAALMAAVFSSGVAAWTEGGELSRRFGGQWSEYRSEVRLWLPRWRPRISELATTYVARTCEPCDEVGGFLTRREKIGLNVRAAEDSPARLTRITYVCASENARGVAAIGRSLEHVNLAWAVMSWIIRLPGVLQFFQLIADAVGGGPRLLGARSIRASIGGLGREQRINAPCDEGRARFRRVASLRGLVRGKSHAGWLTSRGCPRKRLRAMPVQISSTTPKGQAPDRNP